jgi:hypothetical protein
LIDLVEQFELYRSIPSFPLALLTVLDQHYTTSFLTSQAFSSEPPSYQSKCINVKKGGAAQVKQVLTKVIVLTLQEEAGALSSMGLILKLFLVLLFGFVVFVTLNNYGVPGPHIRSVHFADPSIVPIISKIPEAAVNASKFTNVLFRDVIIGAGAQSTLATRHHSLEGPVLYCLAGRGFHWLAGLVFHFHGGPGFS